MGNPCACPSPDHPRACGEHCCSSPAPAVVDGSSPRLRGTLAVAFGDDGHLRIIPAPAGNTSSFFFSNRSISDHPRACGEHNLARSTTFSISGSSPRLRGTQSGKVKTANQARIIPAPAGNTRPLVCACLPLADHPRACGEHNLARSTTFSISGSSPRLRGTRSRKV